MEFNSLAGRLPHVPDHIGIPEFMFNYVHPNKPERNAETPWLVDSETGRKVFGEEIRLRTFSLANALKANYGIGDGDVVLVFSRNHIDYAIMTWAVLMLGGVISGANPDFAVGELAYQIRETKPAILVTLPDFLEVAMKAARSEGISDERVVLFNVHCTNVPAVHTTVDELVRHGVESNCTFEGRKFRPGEAKTKLAFLSFSSGTTGRPKAVAISHYAVMTNMIQLAAHNKVNEDYCAWEDRRFRPGDVILGTLPLYHIYGNLVNLHFSLFCGMTYIVCPKFNYIGMLECIMRYRVTHLMLVPPQAILLCKHPATGRYNLRRHVRYILCGAAPLTAEVNERLFQMFPDAHIGQAYGLTETCSANVIFSINRKRGISGSSGVLMPGVVVKVVKCDGTLGGYDEEGELMIKTPSVTLGYANNQQATKETFLAGGWVKSGDIGKIRRDGEVFVVDRLKEIIKVKGFQVAPAELEGCLLDHPDVAGACVVGIPDDYSGEVPKAFIVLKAAAAAKVQRNANAAEAIKRSIMKHVAEDKVKYKHLAGGVEFVPSIPTSPSGKLLRQVLRRRGREMRGKAVAML